jgi:uncharacterized protein (TIGR02265 family)
MEAGVIYAHTVEAFVQRVLLRRGLLSLDLDKALKTRGFDASRPSELKLAIWLEVLRIVAKHGQPNASEADALEWVGYEMVRGYCDGLVGKSLFMLLRMLGAKRAMLRIAANYGTADSVTRVTAVARGDSAVDLEFNSDFGVPFFIKGVLLESLVQINAANPAVSFSTLPSGSVMFSTSWASVQ